MRRIYQPFSGVHAGTTLSLSDTAHHHLYTVLRTKEGEEIVVFNGEGESWSARVTHLAKKQGEITLLEPLDNKTESPLGIHLAQAVSKGDRMDLVMQKATELGVHAITPILTERGNVKLDAERWAKKSAHWHQIIVHACEQSGRSTLPVLHPVVDLKQWFTQPREGLKLILSPTATQSLSALPQPEAVTLLIGPEGGLTNQEIAFATDRFDFQAIKMGPRVLRTETAAMAALSALQYEWGDLG